MKENLKKAQQIAMDEGYTLGPHRHSITVMLFNCNDVSLVEQELKKIQLPEELFLKPVVNEKRLTFAPFADQITMSSSTALTETNIQTEIIVTHKTIITSTPTTPDFGAFTSLLHNKFREWQQENRVINYANNMYSHLTYAWTTRTNKEKMESLKNRLMMENITGDKAQTNPEYGLKVVKHEDLF